MQSFLPSASALNAVVALLAVWATGSHLVLASDAVILLDFQSQLSRTYHSSWSISNVANVCSWKDVHCDGENRVRHIDVRIPAGVVADGSALQTLTNLTRLVDMNMIDVYNWTGSFPQEFFYMLNLKYLVIEGSLSVTFPATINAPFAIFEMNGMNYTGTLPESLPYAALESLIFQGMEIRCPLPQSVVNRMKATPPLRCQFAETLLQIDSNQMLCGQIHMSEVPCRMYPLIGPSPIFVGQNETSNIAAPLQYTATYKNLVIEFRQDMSASFFVTYSAASGVQLPYREQYAKFTYYPLTVPSQTESLIMTRYSNMEWMTPKKLLLNSTMFLPSSNRIIRVAWIYEFDADITYIAIGGVQVKFSIYLNRVNYTWPSIGRAGLGISVTYRIPHAPEQGPPMLCQTVYYCSSPTANWTTEILPDFGSKITVRTNLIEFIFGYGSVGTIDGVSISESGVLKIKVSYFFSGTGFERLVASAASRGRLSDIRPPGRDQFMSIVARLDFPTFTDFYYDPDLSLRVLFDTSSPPSTLPNAPVASFDAIEIAVGVIVSIVVIVAVFVAVGGTTLFVKIIFPYIRSRTNSKSHVEIESASSEIVDSPRWAAATPALRI